MKRKALGKKIRFEVFKRDSFVCQYCGGQPPTVILEVDHILPVAEGGQNDYENLITACKDCNRGKSKNRLTSITPGVSRNIEDLQEKRLQLKEFYKFQKEVAKIQEQQLDEVCEHWAILHDYEDQINERGRASLRIFLKKLDIEEVKEAMDICMRIKTGEDNQYRYMCGVCHQKIRNKSL